MEHFTEDMVIAAQMLNVSAEIIPDLFTGIHKHIADKDHPRSVGNTIIYILII